MHLMALGAFLLHGVLHLPRDQGETLRRIASGRKSTPPTSKHEVRISDFSLRLLVLLWTTLRIRFAPEIAAVTGVLFHHHTSHLESNCKVVDWKDRQWRHLRQPRP